MKERRDAGKQVCRNGGIKERRYSRDEVCKFTFHTFISTILVFFFIISLARNTVQYIVNGNGIMTALY